MAVEPWTHGPMFGFDLESTGVSVEQDRIVSASLVNVQPGLPVQSESIYINPGMSIPQGAVDVHGITDEWIREHGGDPAESIEAIIMVLAAVLSNHDQPIVGHNLVYDLTMLDREARRHYLVPLCDRIDIWPCIDTLVLDKAVDRFRKGTGMRKLDAIGPLYNCPSAGRAHTSAADALMACRVAYRIGTVYPAVGALSLEQLHAWQTELKVGQDKSLVSWLKGQKRDYSDCTGEWPYRPLARPPIEPTDNLEDVPLW